MHCHSLFLVDHVKSICSLQREGGGFGVRLEGTTAFNIRNCHCNLNTLTDTHAHTQEHIQTQSNTHAKITGLYGKSASAHWSQKVFKSTLSELKGGQSRPVYTGKNRSAEQLKCTLFRQKDNSGQEVSVENGESSVHGGLISNANGKISSFW